MNFGIIAAGEGSRLVQEGVLTPKPLLRLGGKPMIQRLIEIFERCGAESVCVVINEEMTEVRQFLETLPIPEKVEFDIMVKSTPSSMHSFKELSRFLRKRDKFVVTTVDTVFREDDFRSYVEAFEELDTDCDGLMAVTDFIDDEKPLYVDVDADWKILAFNDSPSEGCRFVSGGIYGLGKRALEVLDLCMSEGTERMRNFQRRMLAEDMILKAWPMGRIVDVDHVSDIAKAEEILNLPIKVK